MDWKQFEEFVSRLERLLADLKAKVKTNDSVIDRYGQPRQVDATVRLQTGTTELLIIIECRRRKRISDVTWVEQTHTKKDNLRADKAVLVSNARLSGPAQKMAADKGIEIRTLAEIDESFVPYMFPNRLEYGRVLGWHSERIQVIPAERLDDQSMRLELERAVKDQLPITLSFPDGETTSLQDAIVGALDALGPPHIAPDVTRISREIDLLPRTVRSVLSFGSCELPLSAIRITAVAESERLESRTFFGEYRSDTNQVDHYVAFAETPDGGAVGLAAAGRKGENRFRVNVPAAFFEPKVRDGIDPERGVTLEICLDDKGLPTFRRVS